MALRASWASPPTEASLLHAPSPPTPMPGREVRRDQANVQDLSFEESWEDALGLNDDEGGSDDAESFVEPEWLV